MNNHYAFAEKKRSRLTVFFSWFSFLVLLIATSSAMAQTTPCSPSDEEGTSAMVSENPASGTIVRTKAGEEGISSISQGATAALATNRGTIVTCGGPYSYTDDQDNRRFRFSNGIRATVSSGDKDATAINEAGAVVETRGLGANGVLISISTGSGSVTGINSGKIVRGMDIDNRFHFPSGIGGSAIGTGSVNLTNTKEGVIEGAFSIGMTGYSGTGAITLLNAGRISLPGGVLIVGMSANTGGDFVRMINEGIVEINTGGAIAGSIQIQGLSLSSTRQHSGRSEAINRGRVSLQGTGAVGISIRSTHAGTSENPNSLRAVNEKGGTISINGPMGYGITVAKNVQQEEYNIGRLVVENHGVINVTGDFLPITGSCFGPSGIFAVHSISGGIAMVRECRISPADTHHTGDVRVVNTGTIQAVGRSIAGIAAANLGNGRTIVEITNGRIVAGSPSPDRKFGFGILATVHTDHAGDDPDPTDDIDLEVTVSGPSATVTAYGEGVDDPLTRWDDSRGIGILGMVNGEIDFVSRRPDLTGHIEVEISNGATINAQRALLLVGAKAYVSVFNSTVNGDIEYDHHALNNILTLRGGVISGNVKFFGGDDMFKVNNRGFVAGNVEFGEGNDTLILDVTGSGAQASSISGTISGLEMLNKRGPGQARIGNYSMSDGGTLSIEGGELIVGGHLDLGSTGTVTVRAGSRLTFEVGNIADDSTSYGRITASSVVFQSGASKEVYIQLASRQTNEMAVQTRLRQGIDLLLGDTRYQTAGADGSTSNAGMVMVKTMSGSVVGESDDQGASTITADVETGMEISRNPTVAVASAADFSDSSALYAGAALALLWWLARDDAETEFVDYETHTQNMGSISSFVRNREPGIETWAKTTPNSINGLTPLQGIAAGVDANFESDGYLGISVEPLASGFMKSEHLSLGGDSRYSGDRYQIRGRWNSGAFFTSGSFSYGNYDASAQFRNPVMEDGMLGGNFQMLHSHLQLTAGSRLNIGSELIFVPSLSVYQGSVKQSAYHAENSVLRAEVPEYSQRYQGWKLGFQVKSPTWRKETNGLKWRHSAGISTQSFRSRASSLTLQQLDKTDSLSFVTTMPVRGLPSTVHSFNAGIAIAKSRNFRVKLNYVGLMTDGEFHHGATVQTHYKF